MNPTTALTSTTLETGTAEPIQFVTADGDITALGRRFGIDIELSRQLFRDMFLARRFDSEAYSLQRQGELGLWLQCAGQEAAQVGSIRALRDSDHVFPSYREHAVVLARGVTPGQLLAQWRGVTHSGWDPAEHHLHFYSLVLGTQTLHATGYAMGVKLDGTDEVTTVYFGDGAASQGDVNEALNWAAAGHVPVLFFCQNNQWAISTPTTLQQGAPLHQRASGFGLESYHVDGNDALAVHAVTSQAAAAVRSGRGPALIEARTFRMAGHSTSDDPSRYRTEHEVKEWADRDPLTRLERLLRREGTPEDFFDDLEAEAAILAQNTREACHALASPDLADLFDHVYAEPHPLMHLERTRYLAHNERMQEA